MSVRPNTRKSTADRPAWTIVVPAGNRRRITRTFVGSRRDAERRERDLLAAVQEERWSEIDRTRLRATVTLDQIAGEWIAAGMPKPGGRGRTQAQQDSLAGFLNRALTWWGNRSPAGIGPKDFTAFGEFKRSNARSGTGERQADLELVALHQCCLWAVSSGRITVNAFATRPTYRDSAAVNHCAAGMPASDEELHRLIGHLFAGDPGDQVAGAHLLFQALTGLRPGEPGALLWKAGPDQPGQRVTITRDSVKLDLLRVQRCKGGINPAVAIHPVLAGFLDVWRRFTASTWPDSPWMFPDPEAPENPFVPFGQVADSHIGRTLARAAAHLGLPARKPHGMRAYYVRVRRSQGIDDATIAVELGQGSGPGLVVRTYGERLALLGGDGLFDWLPDPPEAPCWKLLEERIPTNVVALSKAA